MGMGDFHELGWEGVQAENGGMRVPEASMPCSMLADTSNLMDSIMLTSHRCRLWWAIVDDLLIQ